MGWVIRVEDWAEIRRLHGLGLSSRAISRQLGVARDTVARALASPGPPVYSRPPVPSGFDPFEPAVSELLRECPSMPASVLAERVGWKGSASWFRKRVAPLRVGWARVDPADRLEYLPGDQAQCDLWFPPVRIPLGHDRSGCPPVLVIALSHSRFLTALMLPTRTTGDLLAGMWSLLAEVGGVPRRLVWDNEAGIGRRGHLAEGVAGFAGTLATRIVQLKPFDPESKGIVERANRYLETSFLPGRSFTGPADFNAQLGAWLPLANTRQVRRTGTTPAALLPEDRAGMLALPPVPPVTGFTAAVRLPRDYYVRVHGVDYSVDPAAVGRMVNVRADLQQVTVTCSGHLVAAHQRCWAPGLTVTDPTHVATAARLRERYQRPARTPDPADGLVRDLAAYDATFGVTTDAGGQVA